MTFPALKGHDAYILRAPDECGEPFDQGRENALIDVETDEARDDEDERRKA